MRGVLQLALEAAEDHLAAKEAELDEAKNSFATASSALTAAQTEEIETQKAAVVAKAALDEVRSPDGSLPLMD